MKRVAIMQPYFFPSIRYFQLIHASDIFIIYDDVNFIKRGWINRNRILINGEANYITVPLKKASQNKYINQIHISHHEIWQKKMLKSIEFAYKKSPFFFSIYPVVEDVIQNKCETILDLSTNSIQAVLESMGLTLTMKYSSDSNVDAEGLNKSDRLIAITKENEGLEYLNPIGGKSLYQKDYFNERGVSLLFLKSKWLSYEQFENDFVSDLSIIDVLMFNGVERTKKLLSEYEIR